MVVRDIYIYQLIGETTFRLYGLNPKRAGICIDQAPGESETDRMVNG